MHHRFLVSVVPPTGELATLDADESRHARVLRLGDRETVEIFDGRGNAATAVMRGGRTEGVQLEVTGPAESREPAIHVTLALGSIQPDRFELAIQKGTELGVSAFIPLMTRFAETRVERIVGKLDRWRRIAAEAAKQCGRSRIPAIAEPADMKAVFAGADRRILFDPSGETLQQAAVDRVTLLVGPEGGWHESELDLARRNGADVASLGERRLRAETAAIVAVAGIVRPWS